MNLYRELRELRTHVISKLGFQTFHKNHLRITYLGPTKKYPIGKRYGLSSEANGRGVFIHQGRDKYVDPEVVAKMEDGPFPTHDWSTNNLRPLKVPPAREYLPEV